MGLLPQASDAGMQTVIRIQRDVENLRVDVHNGVTTTMSLERSDVVCVAGCELSGCTKPALALSDDDERVCFDDAVSSKPASWRWLPGLEVLPFGCPPWAVPVLNGKRALNLHAVEIGDVVRTADREFQVVGKSRRRLHGVDRFGDKFSVRYADVLGHQRTKPGMPGAELQRFAAAYYEHMDRQYHEPHTTLGAYPRRVEIEMYLAKEICRPDVLLKLERDGRAEAEAALKGQHRELYLDEETIVLQGGLVDFRIGFVEGQVTVGALVAHAAKFGSSFAANVISHTINSGGDVLAAGEIWWQTRRELDLSDGLFDLGDQPGQLNLDL